MNKFLFDPSYHELWCRNSTGLLDRRTIPTPYHSLVENVFVISNPSQVAAPTVVLPDISPHIILYLYKNGKTRFRMIGPRSKAVFLTHTNRAKTIIFRFRPASIEKLLLFPLQDCLDGSTHLSEAFEELFDYDELHQAIEEQHIEKLVYHILGKLEISIPYMPRKVSSHIMNLHFLENRVGEVSKSLGISDRYLHKKVKEETGLSPKMILKIKRLTAVLLMANTWKNSSYTQLALEAGYYDQSHMIDEFQQFFSQTPTQLLS
ncbi:MAG: AraC family transcriptional regulator [Bacteroidota bacterium]